MEITTKQKEGLNKVNKLSSKKATQSLSQFIGTPVKLKIEEPKIEKLNSVNANNKNSDVYALFEVMGDLPGFFVIMTTKESAMSLIKLVKKSQFNEEVTVVEVEEDTLGETANIITSSYLGELSNQSKLSCVASVPSIAQKSGNKVIEELIHFLNKQISEVLVMSTVISAGNQKINAEMAILLKDTSLELLLENINKN